MALFNCIVPHGTERIPCSKCPLVCHRKCLINLQKPLLPPLHAANDSCDSILENSCRTDDPYICPQCSDDINARNKFYSNKYSKVQRLHAELCATIKIQSFCRMVPFRAGFRRARYGVVLMQRKFRSDRFWRRKEQEKADQLRPFRIRVHNIYLFLRYVFCF